MRDCNNSAVIVNTVPMQSARQRWDCTSILRHSIFNLASTSWTGHWSLDSGQLLQLASYENRQWTGLLHSGIIVAREAMRLGAALPLHTEINVRTLPRPLGE